MSVAVTWLSLACCTSALAQKVTTVEGLTLTQTLGQLTGPLGSRPVGEAIGLATALEIATAPFGTSSGGFVFKLDPATGLLVRTATTFGPSFAARAITSGEGQVSVGVNFPRHHVRQAERPLARPAATGLCQRGIAEGGADRNRRLDAHIENAGLLRRGWRHRESRHRGRRTHGEHQAGGHHGIAERRGHRDAAG